MAKRHAVKRFYSLKAKRPSRRVPPKASGSSGQSVPVAPERHRIAVNGIDWSFAVRNINVEHVGRLADAAHLPPIAVWEVETGRYRGIDGYHRWRLAKSRGEKSVVAILRRFPLSPAGEKAFDFECVRSNLQHGLPLTREERDRAIVRIWKRWGTPQAHGEGETLDKLGLLFNLTKQRVHQIISAGQQVGEGTLPRGQVRDTAQPANVERRDAYRRRPAPGGFSTFGRFSAATRRLSKLFSDTEFVARLLQEDAARVSGELRQVRNVIDHVLARLGS